MGGFLSSIFTGSNPTLEGNINNAGNIEGFGTGVGEGAVNNAQGFYSDLLGGNPEQTSKLLAPQIKDIQDQGQQKMNTNAEFGDRSGGTNASNQTTMDTSRANIDNMISQLTGSAAGAEANLGTNLLNTGLSANQQQEALSQDQLNNQQNSLFGNILGGAAGNLGTGLSGMGSGLIGF